MHLLRPDRAESTFHILLDVSPARLPVAICIGRKCVVTLAEIELRAEPRVEEIPLVLICDVNGVIVGAAHIQPHVSVLKVSVYGNEVSQIFLRPHEH